MSGAGGRSAKAGSGRGLRDSVWVCTYAESHGPHHKGPCGPCQWSWTWLKVHGGPKNQSSGSVKFYSEFRDLKLHSSPCHWNPPDRGGSMGPKWATRLDGDLKRSHWLHCRGLFAGVITVSKRTSYPAGAEVQVGGNLVDEHGNLEELIVSKWPDFSPSPLLFF